MRKRILTVKFSVALAIIILASFAGLSISPVEASAPIGFYEGQVTSNAANQTNPDIYRSGSDERIVYQDDRNGNWDIYLYAPQLFMWNQEFRVTTNSANQINPKIYNNIIVWEDNRNGYWSIYIYNITSKVETKLTNSTANQLSPDIDGNRIVWQDYRTGKWTIYVYDLSTKTESRVTDGPNQHPAISGNRVVYEASLGWFSGSYYVGYYTITHIYCTDFSTGQQFDVTNYGGIYLNSGTYGGLVYDSSYQPHVSYENPVITGNRVAFRDKYGEIYMRDISTWAGAQLTSTWQTEPGAFVAINENQPGVYYIVYMDKRNGNWDIYLYNTLYAGSGDPLEYRVTDNTADQTYPAVSGGYIVYQDKRNGNWDIYETAVGYGVGGGPPNPSPSPPGYPSPALATWLLQESKRTVADSSVIPTSDFDGANDKVKENRRNAILNKLDAAMASIQTAVNTENMKVRRTNCQSAIDQLNDLLYKTDGVLRGTPDTPGSGYTPDWIINLPAQESIYPPIASCRIILQMLLENIS